MKRNLKIWHFVLALILASGLFVAVIGLSYVESKVESPAKVSTYESVELTITVKGVCADDVSFADITYCKLSGNNILIESPLPFILVYSNGETEKSENLKINVTLYEHRPRPEIWVNEHVCTLDVPWVAEVGVVEMHTLTCGGDK